MLYYTHMNQSAIKNFVMQLAALISLYLSLSFLLVLAFGVINLMFPDAADSVWQIESNHGAVRFGIAMSIVFFPAFLVLTRLVNKARRKEEGEYFALTRWAIYLSLLVAGLVLLGDLVAVIFAFLEGEITTRFILKALALLVVIGLAFYYYILDARGYWLKNESKSKMVGLVAGLIALATIVTGFYHIDTPQTVREMKIDEEQKNDLQTIQWEIQNYINQETTIPANLEALNNAFDLPEAPEGREAYEYRVTDNGFALCATFAEDYKEEYYGEYSSYAYDKSMTEPYIVNDMDWRYKAGRYCFEREVRNLTQ